MREVLAVEERAVGAMAQALSKMGERIACY
jgi:hypothetical protein